MALAGLALAVLSLVLPSLIPAMSKKLARVGFVVALLLLAGSGLLAFLPDVATVPSGPTITAPGNGNCNVAGSNNQVNCNAPSQGGLSKEDLRFRFFTDSQGLSGQPVGINFVFENLGTSYANITGLGLYEVVRTKAAGDKFNIDGQLGDPDGFQWDAGGPERSPTWKMIDDGRPIYYYSPATLAIDGREAKNAFLNLAPTQTVSITARFNVERLDEKKFEGAAFLPVIHSTNLAGNKVYSYCLGVITEQAGKSLSAVNTSQGVWFRMLPRKVQDFSCNRLQP